MKKVKIKNIESRLRYIKKISKRQIFDGIRMCIDNADMIIGCSKILFKNKKFSLSASLAVLAIESVGEVGLLTLVGSNILPDIHRIFFWENLKQHDMKLSMSIPGIVAGKVFSSKKEISLKEWKDIGLSFEKIMPQYNEIKKEGFYVNFDKKTKRFVSPQAKRKKRIAMKLINLAEKTIQLQKLFFKQGFKNFLKISEETEMEIIEKFLTKRSKAMIKSVKKSDMDTKEKKAKVEFYKKISSSMIALAKKDKNFRKDFSEAFKYINPTT